LTQSHVRQLHKTPSKAGNQYLKICR